MFARHETMPGKSTRLGGVIVNPEQQLIEQYLVAALAHALSIATPEISGLRAVVPMAEAQIEPSGIHVVWIFDCRRSLALALEDGCARLLYQLSATAMREARMQIDGIDVKMHFDTEEDCLRQSHGNWDSRLSLQHYPARQLQPSLP
jgi:hypothetical protein